MTIPHTAEHPLETPKTGAVDATPKGPTSGVETPPFGRVFFHPVVDLLFICGGFSLPLLLLRQPGAATVGMDGTSMLLVFIVVNYAHFASSTVRLYTKPRASAEHPFLAFGFPVVALLAVLASVALPDVAGRLLIAAYLTWSPFHYAKQAFGLALMYGHRSGTSVTSREKRWLLWICLLPFIRAIINPHDTSVSDVMGVRSVLWLFEDVVFGYPAVVEGLGWIVTGLTPLVFVLPVAFAVIGRARLPWLSVSLILTNGIWLVGFSFFEGAVWATVAHSIQYLLVVSYAHAQDQARSPVKRTGRALSPRTHMGSFYLLSVLVGVPLFIGVPMLVQEIGRWVGQSWSAQHCVTMTVVAINLHHFIVDGYIWRSRRPSPKTS